MKIGLPKLRLSRKLIIVTLGITVLLGGTGMTALYFGGNALKMEDGTSAIGGECTVVQTMLVKTPANGLWLRKFIRMEKASGPERVRTALRIAGLLAKKNAVDLIHVSVLDANGPTKRAEMRSRAIGAEVLVAIKPQNLPEMKTPAMATYYEGSASSQGRYYGDKIIVDMPEIGAMMTAMRTIDEKPDCVDPNAEAAAAAKEKKQKPEKKEGAEKPEEAGKESAEEGKTIDGAEAKPEQSFVQSMLSMVGLGSADKPAQANEDGESKAAESSEDGAEKPSTPAEQAEAEKPEDAAQAELEAPAED